MRSSAINPRYEALIVAAVFLGSALPISSVAQGQSAAAASADDAETAEMTPLQAREAARVAYERGQELFGQGQYEEAEVAFQEAYDRVPNPVVLVGIAGARERQGNTTGAVEALEAYLAEREDAPDRAQIEERIAQMRALPATLHITSTPTGAAILLDGEPTGQTTPADLEVTPGAHVVGLELADHEAVEANVDAQFGIRAELTLELADAVPDALEGEGEPVPTAELDDLDEAEDGDSGPGTAVWVLSGLAVAGVVTGTVLGFLALTQESEFDDMPSDATADKGERFALFADVALGVAAVSAITAIVVFITQSADNDEEELDDDELEASLTPYVGPTGGGLLGRVEF